MSFGIIIKGKHGSEKSRRFKPHFNRAIVSKSKPHGTYIHTKEQYRDELRKNDLVPYDKANHEWNKPKDFKPSKECRQAVQHIKDTKGNPSGGWYAWLEKKGYSKKKLETLRRNAVKYTKGGRDGFQNDT